MDDALNKTNVSLWLMPSAVVLFTIAMIATLVLFFRAGIIRGHEKIGALHGEIQALKERRRLIEEHQVLLAAWEEPRQKLEQFFFKPDRLVGWLEFLETQARRTDLLLDVASLSEQESGTPLLRVTLQGSFSHTVAFLRAIDAGPYAIGIREYDLRDSESGVITQLTLALYVAP